MAAIAAQSEEKNLQKTSNDGQNNERDSGKIITDFFWLDSLENKSLNFAINMKKKVLLILFESICISI